MVLQKKTNKFRILFRNNAFFRLFCSAVIGIALGISYIFIHQFVMTQKLTHENMCMTNRIKMVEDSLEFYDQYLDVVTLRRR
ncbi:MAG: hypothetical protein PF590_09630, partial [Candidatus Delongbacteria bacterium]|nr:hypothetical protein [Candidatus Delongbacteria bacterium]